MSLAHDAAVCYENSLQGLAPLPLCLLRTPITQELCHAVVEADAVAGLEGGHARDSRNSIKPFEHPPKNDVGAV